MEEQQSVRPRWARAAERDEPLFKFRTYSPDKDADPDCQGYAASLLRDGLLYCPSPHELNDPWDGRPAFTIPDPDTDAEHANRFCEMLLESSRAGSRGELDSWLQREGYAGVARQMQDAHWRENGGVGLFCMAGNPVHPLMWSYYASGHQGFCWIIDHRQTPFAHATRVDYLPDYPSIDWARWKDLDLLKLSLLTKADFWQHEDEYRLIVPRTHAPQHFTIVPHNGRGSAPPGRYLKINPDAIGGVIFGAGMKSGQRRALARIANEYRPNFEFNVAGLQRREYRMAIRPVEGDERAELLG